jgi:hypothetical protein
MDNQTPPGAVRFKLIDLTVIMVIIAIVVLSYVRRTAKSDINPPPVGTSPHRRPLDPGYILKDTPPGGFLEKTLILLATDSMTTRYFQTTSPHQN